MKTQLSPFFPQTSYMTTSAALHDTSLQTLNGQTYAVATGAGTKVAGGKLVRAQAVRLLDPAAARASGALVGAVEALLERRAGGRLDRSVDIDGHGGGEGAGREEGSDNEEFHFGLGLKGF